MLCPNCNEPMHFVSLDNQIVRHCSNCGASFFEENGINRITKESADRLFQDRVTSIIIGREKLCPKDQTPLSQMTTQESIPDTVLLFRCDKCQGVFSYAEDLVNFKKAQTVKVDYFQIWNKPLPSLKSVLVFSFLAFFSMITILTGISNNKNVSKTQAKDLVGKITISSSNRYLFIAFTTSSPVKSEIKFINKSKGTSFTQVINSQAKTVHSLTTDKINLNEKYNYQITLTDEEGKKIITEEKFLELP